MSPLDGDAVAEHPSQFARKFETDHPVARHCCRAIKTARGNTLVVHDGMR